MCHGFSHCSVFLLHNCAFAKLATSSIRVKYFKSQNSFVKLTVNPSKIKSILKRVQTDDYFEKNDIDIVPQ